MKKETDNPNNTAAADEAVPPKDPSPEPSEAVLDDEVPNRKARRSLIAGAGYIPGRLANWLLGRGWKEGDSEEGSPAKAENE